MKTTPKKTTSAEFSIENLKQDILKEARVLHIHSGFAIIISEKVVESVQNFLSSHPIFTEKDIERLVVTELKKYNKDLAYIYHNRDKII